MYKHTERAPRNGQRVHFDGEARRPIQHHCFLVEESSFSRPEESSFSTEESSFLHSKSALGGSDDLLAGRPVVVLDVRHEESYARLPLRAGVAIHRDDLLVQDAGEPGGVDLLPFAWARHLCRSAPGRVELVEDA